MPFGSGYGDRPIMRSFVRSGPGYTLSQSLIDNSIEAEVHNVTSVEPVLNISASAALAAPIIIGVVQLFAPDWTELAATLTAFLTPIVVAFITRGKVWSPASVKKVLDIAITEAEKTRKK